MKKITDFNFYATCPSENGLQIRQARFTKFQIRECEVKFGRSGETAIFASSYGNTEVEIAGMGKFNGHSLHSNSINLYYSFEGARTQNKNELVFEYYRFGYYTEKINLVPLEIPMQYVINSISKKAIAHYEHFCYGNYFKSQCYVWDGTKPKLFDLWDISKFIELDLLNDISIVYTYQDENSMRNKKIYKSAEECAGDNHIEVFTFG